MNFIINLFDNVNKIFKRYLVNSRDVQFGVLITPGRFNIWVWGIGKLCKGSERNLQRIQAAQYTDLYLHPLGWKLKKKDKEQEFYT